MIDVGLLHQFKELAGIGRQAFDVAPLAFGIDRVEGERRLAGAGQAGDHDQLVARDVDIDVLEVVLTRAADRKGLQHDDGPGRYYKSPGAYVLGLFWSVKETVPLYIGDSPLA